MAHVKAGAMRARVKAGLMLREIAERGGISGRHLNQAIIGLETSARVVVHFHPDRATADGSTVAQALLREGRYRNQFETGISNGSLTGFTGGDRDLWEAALFGGAYNRLGVVPADRPKYGALDFLGYSDGAVPFFGSCYFVLKAELLRRSTFTFGDSCEWTHAGVMGEMIPVAAAMMKFVEDGHTFARDRVTVDEIATRLARGPWALLQGLGARLPGRILEYYIEAQVHGAVEIARDVELLVADPSYCGTAIGYMLERLCQRNSVPLRWHAGFSLPAAGVPNDFVGPLSEHERGARMPALADRIAGTGMLDAAALGRAAATLNCDGQAPDEFLKDINHLWYLLVYFGAPHGVQS